MELGCRKAGLGRGRGGGKRTAGSACKPLVGSGVAEAQIPGAYGFPGQADKPAWERVLNREAAGLEAVAIPVAFEVTIRSRIPTLAPGRSPGQGDSH